MRIFTYGATKMKNNWYLARYKDGKFVDKSPYGLMRSEADNLLSLAQLTDKGFTYRVVWGDDV